MRRLFVLICFFVGPSWLGADTPLRVRVTDADSGEPIAARLYLQSTDGDWHYFESADRDGSAMKYEKQNWINKDSVEYHTTVSPHDCVAHVPVGGYTLRVERGKSCFPQTRSLRLGEHGLVVTVGLKRWNDPASRGWYSGDTHLHRTINELINVVDAEDLNVALPLINWVTLADTPPSAGNKNLGEIPDELVRVDQAHVIWPRNTEYEIFSVGGKRHTLGALFVLGHRRPLQLGVPPWRPIIRSVQQSDPQAIFDMDKLDWPFAMLLPTIAPHAVYELANNHVWQTEFAFRKWNSFAPPYMRPPFGASEGGHREWLDYTMGMYYTLLNCGFELPPSAGTANGVHPVPAGFGRVYVHLPEGFSLDGWMRGLKAGRSFVTTGPMLYATAAGKDPGHRFRTDAAQAFEIDGEVISERPLSYGELLVNGRPITLLRPLNRKTEEGAFRSEFVVPVPIDRSGWFAIRFWESRPDGQSRFVHSAPWYVTVADEPVKLRREERDYLVSRVTAEIGRSEGTVSNEALNEYRAALAHYESLPVLQPSLSESRKPEPSTEERWLDNMILDHQFTADEVRVATGLSRTRALEAVRERLEREAKTGLRVRPYPGGRHPRTGFLDGAIAPQRETKVSVFTPWQDGGYVVVDVPEAVFSNLGLIYLAHTHVPTIWDEKATMERLEWTPKGSGLVLDRRLPNGIVLSSHVQPAEDGVAMRIDLTNGTDKPLSKLRVQVCV
ncbi:MAG: CehA/McbA family metallohydrolase, partial [Planctomycetota bacterium]